MSKSPDQLYAELAKKYNTQITLPQFRAYLKNQKYNQYWLSDEDCLNVEKDLFSNITKKTSMSINELWQKVSPYFDSFDAPYNYRESFKAWLTKSDFPVYDYYAIEQAEQIIKAAERRKPKLKTLNKLYCELKEKYDLEFDQYEDFLTWVESRWSTYDANGLNQDQCQTIVDGMSAWKKAKKKHCSDEKPAEILPWDKRVANFLGKAKSVKELQYDETIALSVPKKIELFNGLDITEKDKIDVIISSPAGLFFENDVLLVNGEDNIVAIFDLKQGVSYNGKSKTFLTASSEFIHYDGHNNSHYAFIFKVKHKACYRKVNVEAVCRKPKEMKTHLCIDFGTSNTTVGCFIDEPSSDLAVSNGMIKPKSENFTSFAEKDDNDNWTYKNVVPTIVYVKNCEKKDNIRYLFGYDALIQIKEDKYCPKASCFMEIKRWTSDIDKDEEIHDAKGNKTEVGRKEILTQYLMYIIRNAENQFKCKFKNVHISTPVKLKSKVLGFYSEILKEKGYELETRNAIDEGVAVLFSMISNQVLEGKYKTGKEEKALIIDCGGGTSDLASCSYIVDDKDKDCTNLTIKTQYMNGDMNFGGNNLTYRIMQYMKVVYAQHFMNGTRTKIDDIISEDVNELFSYIEGETENDDDAKVKERYDSVYNALENNYAEAEKVIPTKYKEFENRPLEDYDKVKNNFYFLWTLAEEMKKEFYRSSSITRYQFGTEGRKETDLHVKKIDTWKLSAMKDGVWDKKYDHPDITFTSKEIDKLIRADIYYLIRKFLNNLYENKTLDSYSLIKLSGQSSKINIFMDALKEFLPGKKIKGRRVYTDGDESEELKLLCLKGAIEYFHAIETSEIDVVLTNEAKNIPISLYVKGGKGDLRKIFHEGKEDKDWDQPAEKRRLTAAGTEIEFYITNVDNNVSKPFKYEYDFSKKLDKTTLKELKDLSNGKINQEALEDLPDGNKYIFVYLDKEKWGFNILQLSTEMGGKCFKGELEFHSFDESGILQETFFNGKR